MSKFEYAPFNGGYDELAVSKEKYTKEHHTDLIKALRCLDPQWQQSVRMCGIEQKEDDTYGRNKGMSGMR